MSKLVPRKPFSWKEAKKEAIQHMKYRQGIYEKIGRVDEAKRMKIKISMILERQAREHIG